MTTEKQNEIRSLETVASEVIKNQIYEYLEMDIELENIIEVHAKSFEDIHIKVFGYKVISVRKDVDDSMKYNTLFSSPRIYIKDDTTEKEISRYYKAMEFFSYINSKVMYEKIKGIIICNMILLNEESLNIAEA